ncbi:polyprenol reductase 2 isoform X1 [Vigna radiata var. radiata]|uniref:Polyprenol reductase 2 isoform X1 n=1 Tax=Vigna radiata var. radiata TaxID=3916 RepID=A0A1S3W135_VIGRR|nr:polyprenol reductase 2 isoform X1 [Vigna radiata var. radiata]
MFLQNQSMEELLVQFLRASWLAATLPIVIASFSIPSLSFLRRTLLGLAGRGKIMQSSSQKFTIPQRLFFHFYLVAFLWTTLLLVATWAYAYRMVPVVAEPFSYSTITSFLTGGSTIRTDSHKLRQGYAAWESVSLLLLMAFHVLRRLYETIHVFDYSPSARMHVIGYLTGLFFYIAAPLSLCGDCAVEVFNFVANLVTEFIVKGKNQMQVTELDIWQVLTPLIRLGWKHWIAVAVFLWGWIHQYHCHKILGSLRHSTDAEEYVIPHGDWFEIVSSPHYLSEIVIYASFVVATGGSNLTIWLLFAFVVANLSFAAVETHKWYRQKFKDYPSNRFAIIPFLL